MQDHLHLIFNKKFCKCELNNQNSNRDPPTLHGNITYNGNWWHYLYRFPHVHKNFQSIDLLALFPSSALYSYLGNPSALVSINRCFSKIEVDVLEVPPHFYFFLPYFSIIPPFLSLPLPIIFLLLSLTFQLLPFIFPLLSLPLSPSLFVSLPLPHIFTSIYLFPTIPSLLFPSAIILMCFTHSFSFSPPTQYLFSLSNISYLFLPLLFIAISSPPHHLFSPPSFPLFLSTFSSFYRNFLSQKLVSCAVEMRMKSSSFFNWK